MTEDGDGRDLKRVADMLVWAMPAPSHAEDLGETRFRASHLPPGPLTHCPTPLCGAPVPPPPDLTLYFCVGRVRVV